jgi:hypothetical protein
VDIVVCNSNFGKLESKVAAAKVQCEINSVKLDTEPANVKLDSKPAATRVEYWEDHWSGIPLRVTCYAAPAKVKRNLCADKDKRHKKPRVAQVQGESKLIVAHGKEWELKKPAAAHVQYWEDHWSGISFSVTRHAAPAKVKCNLCADFRAEEI